MWSSQYGKGVVCVLGVVKKRKGAPSLAYWIVFGGGGERRDKWMREKSGCCTLLSLCARRLASCRIMGVSAFERAIDRSKRPKSESTCSFENRLRQPMQTAQRQPRTRSHTGASRPQAPSQGSIPGEVGKHVEDVLFDRLVRVRLLGLVPDELQVLLLQTPDEGRQDERSVAKSRLTAGSIFVLPNASSSYHTIRPLAHPSVCAVQPGLLRQGSIQQRVRVESNRPDAKLVGLEGQEPSPVSSGGPASARAPSGAGPHTCTGAPPTQTVSRQ
eukprot:1195057-Prorocentrum_minimum.AAC.10